MMAALTGSTEVAPAAGTQEETLAKVIHNGKKGNDNDDCTKTNSGRMAMSLSVQATAADADAANETAQAASTRPASDTNTWDGLVQQKLKLQACLDENNPSPSKLIYGTLPTLLKQISLFESVESKQVQIIVQALSRQGMLLPYASLLALINQQDDSESSSTDTAQKLRTLQVQVMVRLQLWSSFGEAFVEQYSKVTEEVQAKGKGKQRRHKKKHNKKLSVLPADLLLQHTMQILSLTAFRLAPNRPFALFLQECLPKSLTLSSSTSNNSYKLPRDTLERIFDNFEVPNPYLARQDDNSAESATTVTALNFVPSPQRRSIIKKQKAEAKQALKVKKDLAIQQAQEKAEAKAKAESDKAHAKPTGTAIPGFPSSMSLSMSLTRPEVASRTKNSLLARDGNLARSRFVGSHFNTNLTNASTLFRQVQVSDRRQQRQSAPVTKNSTLSRKRSVPSKSTSLSSSASTMSSANKSRSKQKQNENAMPPPPPNSRRVVHETPNKSKSMSRRNDIVLETPRQPARRNSLIFGATDDDKNDNTGRTGESNASLVAEAFRAVQQRKR
jgi:hypothetical protein